jgi:hypothetical protein
MISVFRGLGSPYLPTIKEVEMSNNGITWLHVSDWHQEADGHTSNRTVVLAQLEQDITNQRKSLNLDKVDFIVFSGDVAFSGKSQEYQNSQELFDRILTAAGLDPAQDKFKLFLSAY